MPFHDALSLSYACDYGMIFVRCKDGISHNPLEYAAYEDLSLGAEVLYGTVREVLKKQFFVLSSVLLLNIVASPTSRVGSASAFYVAKKRFAAVKDIIQALWGIRKNIISYLKSI